MVSFFINEGIDYNNLTNSSCSLNCSCLMYNCQSGRCHPFWNSPERLKRRRKERKPHINSWDNLYDNIASLDAYIVHILSNIKIIIINLLLLFYYTSSDFIFYSLHWPRYLWWAVQLLLFYMNKLLFLNIKNWSLYHWLPPFLQILQ